MKNENEKMKNTTYATKQTINVGKVINGTVCYEGINDRSSKLFFQQSSIIVVATLFVSTFTFNFFLTHP